MTRIAIEEDGKVFTIFRADAVSGNLLSGSRLPL